MNETDIEPNSLEKAQLLTLVKTYTSVQENSEEWLQAAVPDWLKNTFYRWQHTNTLLEQQPIEVQEVLKPAMMKAQEIILQEMAAEIQAYQGKDAAIIKSQEWRLKAKALKMKLSLLSIDGLGYLGDLKQKFSETKELDRSQITTRPDLFQGWQVAFSQETVDKIMREGYDKSQEPIAVWLDPKSKKYVVISGHSRWHASELLYNKGQMNLKTMSVKVFNGNLEEAQDFAILESNRSGTAEVLKSDLNAYKRAIEKGKSKDYLLSIFKTKARIRLLQDISYLNAKGQFLEYMGEDSEKSFPYLQRNAQWVGILRRLYPSLTNSHEKELFDYLYGSKSAITLKKDTFFNLIEKKASRFDFDPSRPLNLSNVVATSPMTEPVRQLIAEMESHLEEQASVRNSLEARIARARLEGQTTRETNLREELHLLNQAFIRWHEELDSLKRQEKDLERSTQFDLFNQAFEPAKSSLSMDMLKLKAKAARVRLEMVG